MPGFDFSQGLSLFIIAQLIGSVGLLVNVVSFQKKNSNDMIKLHIFANIAGVFHYLLLTQFTGVALCALVMARTKASLHVPAKYMRALVALSVIGVWAIVFLTYKNVFDIFGGICVTLASTALLNKDDPMFFRLNHLAAATCWFMFCLASLSIPGAVNSVMNVSSNIVGMIRHEARFHAFRERLGIKQPA